MSNNAYPAAEPISSPTQFGSMTTSTMMRAVLYCLCPAVLICVFYFGIGILITLLIAISAGLLFESLALIATGKDIRANLADLSAVVTSVLFALALPIGVPWQLIVLGIGFSILIAKHAYGGFGQNCFNPAMCGYLFLLLSYPLDMTIWQVPLINANGMDISPLGLEGMAQSLHATFSGYTATSAERSATIDGMAMATPLIEYKMAAPNSIAQAINQSTGLLDRSAHVGWELMNISYLFGGLVLLQRGIIRWHIPVAFIGSLLVMSLLYYSTGGSNVVGTPYLHLFSGATMLGAFFIATDPVSAATTKGGRLAYGVLIGVCVFSIRVWGSYLDAVAIAIIFANFLAPVLDHLFKPTVYGHESRTQKLIAILKFRGYK